MPDMCEVCDSTWKLACRVVKLPCGCLVCEKADCKTIHRLSHQGEPNLLAAIAANNAIARNVVEHPGVQFGVL